MTRLIVQADDIAITHATTLGILDAIEHGIVRNTGIFTNQPDAAFAADRLKHLGGVDVGIDLNFVTGRPVLDPGLVPDIVRTDGAFRSSHEIRKNFTITGGTPIYPVFEVDPFPYEQTLAEARAQIERFLELFNRPRRTSITMHSSRPAATSSCTTSLVSTGYSQSTTSSTGDRRPCCPMLGTRHRSASKLKQRQTRSRHSEH